MLVVVVAVVVHYSSRSDHLASPSAPVRLASIAMNGDRDGNGVAVAAATTAAGAYDDVAALAFSLALAAGLGRLLQEGTIWQGVGANQQQGHTAGKQSSQRD